MSCNRVCNGYRPRPCYKQISFGMYINTEPHYGEQLWQVFGLCRYSTPVAAGPPESVSRVLVQLLSPAVACNLVAYHCGAINKCVVVERKASAP